MVRLSTSRYAGRAYRLYRVYDKKRKFINDQHLRGGALFLRGTCTPRNRTSKGVSLWVSQSQKSLKQHHKHEITGYYPVWSYMVPYRTVWSPIGPYGPVWSHMVLLVPFGTAWSCIVPNGPVWSLLILYIPGIKISDLVNQNQIVQIFKFCLYLLNN